MYLTRSLREPGGPCTKSMEVSESRMERVTKVLYLLQHIKLKQQFVHDVHVHFAKILVNIMSLNMDNKSLFF